MIKKFDICKAVVAIVIFTIIVVMCAKIVITDFDNYINNLNNKETVNTPVYNTTIVYAGSVDSETSNITINNKNTGTQMGNTLMSTSAMNKERVITDMDSNQYDTTLYNNEYSEYEIYELAKIVMCEAEGESQECKEYICQVILNRVNSDSFPDTIHDVIFDGYQFTPTFDGRWERVEPNQDCYNAVYTVLNASEPLTDALYFEACIGDSWHSNNLIKVAEIDNTRFYIE